MAIHIDDTVQISGETRKNGNLTDPTTLFLRVFDPDGIETVFSWPPPTATIMTQIPFLLVFATGPDNALVRDTAGKFHADVPITKSGTWTFTWTASGDVTATQDGSFIVDPNPETVTILVVNQLLAPIVGVNVQIYQNPITVMAGGITGATGEVTFGNFAFGDYSVELSKSRVAFSNPYSIVVANTGGNTPQAFTLAGVTSTITTTVQARKVKLFGHLLGFDGAAADGVRVQVETVGYGIHRPFLTPGSGSDTGINTSNMFIRPEKRELITNSIGYWEVDVVAGSTIRVEIPDVRFDKMFRVPDDERITMLNIHDARPDPGPGAELGVTSDVSGRDQMKGPG